MVIYSEHEVQRAVELNLRDCIQKRKATDSIEDCVGETGRKKIRAAMGGGNRVPNGLFKAAYKFVTAAPGNESMSEQMFRNRLGPGFAADQYRTTLDNFFDAAWTRATSPYLPSSSDAGEGQLLLTENTMAVESDDDVEAEHIDDVALEHTMQVEASSRSQKAITLSRCH